MGRRRARKPKLEDVEGGVVGPDGVLVAGSPMGGRGGMAGGRRPDLEALAARNRKRKVRAAAAVWRCGAPLGVASCNLHAMLIACI